MKYSRFIMLFGGLDIALFSWIAIKDISNGKIPFIDNTISAINSSLEFGLTINLFLLMNILSLFLVLSFIFSGWLMLIQSKYGVYISLIQAPFRVFLIIQPTFFFLITILSYLNFNSFLLICFIFILEATKILIQIYWLKSTDRTKG